MWGNTSESVAMALLYHMEDMEGQRMVLAECTFLSLTLRTCLAMNGEPVFPKPFPVVLRSR